MAKQVSFLPWAGLKKEIRIGPILFWPFNSKTQNKIQDQEILNHLTKHFHCYVDHQGKPVSTVAICSYDSNDFRRLTNEQLADLRSAADILIFCTIAPQVKNAVCANNRSMGPKSAEMLQLIVQDFNPGDDHIGVRAGSASHGGWKIGEISFPKPWFTGGSLGTPDTELTEGFNKVFDPTFSQDIRKRLFRSLEWFRMAHVENDEVSPLSKVVMMATAFEILLRLPKRDKKKRFVNYMKKEVASDKFKRDTRKTQKGKEEDLSSVECWAWDFYELRNCIVHGDHVEMEKLHYRAPNRNRFCHLIVADLVFWECIKRELFKQRCIGDNVRTLGKVYDDAFPNEQEETAEEPLARGMLDFNKVHQTLGWLTVDRPETSIKGKIEVAL